MKFLRKHVEGAIEREAEYWYVVLDGFSGNQWPEMFYTEIDARKCAEEIGGGTVCIASVRPIEDEDGELWPLPVRTREMELDESEQAVRESEAIFMECMAGAKRKRESEDSA